MSSSSRQVEPPIDYSDYLQLDKILSAQTPWSEKHGVPAHDEHLFIVIHQVYELWFKEILHNIGSVIEMFNRHCVDETNIGVAVQRVFRVNEIMKILIDQVQVLETMTPLDFLDFRNLLGSASGFQSVQFRILESRLGLRHSLGVQAVNRSSPHEFADAARKRLESAQTSPSLFEVVEKWLERTPFVRSSEFDFCAEYQRAVQQLWDAERSVVRANPRLSDAEKATRVQAMEQVQQSFLAVIDPKRHAELRERGEWRLSYASTVAALFISLYRDEPILHLPYRLLASLVEFDERLSTWRHRHSMLVLRMIGTKMGTGGSSGHDYLRSTVERNRVFGDLFSLSSLLTARAHLPVLPPQLKEQLAFHYSVLKGSAAERR